MTATPADFAQLTACHRIPGITFADVRSELQRELAARRATFPAWVKKGRMIAEDENYELAIMEAMIADIDRICARAGSRTETHAFTWGQRRQALRRELAWRQQAYPGWIAKGRLMKIDAQLRTDRLRACLAIYEDGFDWRPPDDNRPIDVQWRDAAAAIATEQPEAQKEMALC